MNQTISGTRVRPYRSEDKPELLPIVERVYDSAVRLRHEFLWDWLQSSPMGNRDTDHVPFVVQRDGLVVGYTGVLRRRFKIGPHMVQGGFLMDSFTSPESRGAGIFLLRHLIGRTDMLMGATNERFVALWCKMLGRKSIDAFQVRKAIRVVDPSALLPRPWRGIFGGAARALAGACEAAIRAAAPRLGDARLESVERFPPAVDGFCARWLEGRRNTAARDREYLDWRFCACPVGYRKRLLWAGDRLAGLAVYRLAEMNGRKVVLLVEILAEGREARRAYGSLLEDVVDFARRNRVTDIQAIEPGCPELRKAFRRWGFFFRPEAPRMVAKIRSDVGDPETIYRAADWFVSAGDSDFEFAYFNQGWRSLEAFRA